MTNAFTLFASGKPLIDTKALQKQAHARKVSATSVEKLRKKGIEPAKLNISKKARRG